MQRALLTTGLCLALAAVAASKNVICYYDRAAAARPYPAQLLPENIDPNLCTHIIFSYADISKNIPVLAAETDKALYEQLNSLKSQNPNLKTLLAVGGRDFNDQEFTSVVASKSNREKFVEAAVNLVEGNDFDGLHLDWLYPGAESKQPKDPERFTALCQELRAAFDPKSLILSSSVAAEQFLIDTYDVPALDAALDIINVLTYDFHNTAEATTAHHSPLGSSDSANTLTTESALSYWVSKGASEEKLHMGIAAYGVAYTLATTNSGDGAAANGPAEVGCYTNKEGFWAYYETCIYIRDGQLNRIADESVPYAVNEGQWVGYDDTLSLDAKVTHIKDEGYGGAVVWALDLDDHTDAGLFCNQGPYPFIGHLSRALLS